MCFPFVRPDWWGDFGGSVARDTKIQNGMPMKYSQAEKLIGLKFGMLTVLEYAGKNKHGATLYKCLCDCGKIKIGIQKQHLAHGNTISCGHLAKIHRLCHGDRMGHGYTTEYRSWYHAKGRCFNPTDKKYRRYGERGITMCAEWKNSYKSFLDYMGRKPSPKHSIDRINNDGNYEPGNCRWATAKEQSANQKKVGLFAGMKKSEVKYASPPNR